MASELLSCSVARCVLFLHHATYRYTYSVRFKFRIHKTLGVAKATTQYVLKLQNSRNAGRAQKKTPSGELARSRTSYRR